jgi:quercetin dioxygenase-like cupin family protein
VHEAQLEDFGSGLTPVTQGWFVVNVRDAEWWSSERRGARCAFENEYGDPPVEFAQFGINVTVLEPGETGLYHAESNQEAFLVLSGECRLLVEDEERRLRPLDFFHAPPWTEHAFVGAGEGPTYKAACPGCTGLADHFDGALPHVNARDITLMAISRAPIAKLNAYKQRMGWRFP